MLRDALSTSRTTYFYSHTPVRFMQHYGKIIVYCNCSVATKIRDFLDVPSLFLLCCVLSLGSNKFGIFWESSLLLLRVEKLQISKQISR